MSDRIAGAARAAGRRRAAGRAQRGRHHAAGHRRGRGRPAATIGPRGEPVSAPAGPCPARRLGRAAGARSSVRRRAHLRGAGAGARGLRRSLRAAGRQLPLRTNIRDMLVRSVALGIVAVGPDARHPRRLARPLRGLPDQRRDHRRRHRHARRPGPRIPLGIGAVLVVGAGVGLVNGLIITKLRVNAFIATLGTALIMRGLLDANFEGASGEVPREFGFLGYGSVGPVPYRRARAGRVRGAARGSCCAPRASGTASTPSAAARRRRGSPACARTGRSSARTSCAAWPPR